MTERESERENVEERYPKATNFYGVPNVSKLLKIAVFIYQCWIYILLPYLAISRPDIIYIWCIYIHLSDLYICFVFIYMLRTYIHASYLYTCVVFVCMLCVYINSSYLLHAYLICKSASCLCACIIFS